MTGSMDPSRSVTSPGQTCFVAVVVATCDRPELLGSVCLPSVAKQTRAPDLVVVVDDSKNVLHYGGTSSALWQHLTDFHSQGTGLQLLHNCRTPGASGAWNTGLLQVMQQQQQGQSLVKAGENDTDCCAETYVAILDDDDCWEPNHLEVCLRAVQQRPSTATPQMAVSGLIRHATTSRPQTEIPASAGRKQSLPNQGLLNPQEFYRGNPHIQGSNLFCRLDVLLAAGMFNEWLPSTTDRDLCIRLTQLGVRVAVTGVHTVHHFIGAATDLAAATSGAAGTSGNTVLDMQPSTACSEGPSQSVRTDDDHMPALPRLSDPCSRAKYLGLHRFYHDLWETFMTPEQQQAAKQRARKLFGVDLDTCDAAAVKSPGQLSGPRMPGSSVCLRADAPTSITAAAQSLHHSSELPAASICSTKARKEPLGDLDSTDRIKSNLAIRQSDTGASTDHHAEEPIVLLVGVVSSSGSIVQGLLSDLLQLMTQTTGDVILGGLEVLLLENGGGGDVGDSVAAVAKRNQQLGLPVHLISRQLQCQHAEAGITAGSSASTSGTLSVGDKIQHEQLQPNQKLPIGVMRTLLQLHLAAMVDGLPDSLKQKSVVMVLDDDKRLLRRSSDPQQLDLSFLHHLQQLKHTRAADVILGVDAGAPPLPAASTLMLGLLDVVSSLQALARLDAAPQPTTDAAEKRECHSPSSGHLSSGIVEKAAAEGESLLASAAAKAAAFNSAAAAVWPDMYYDLSAAHTSHLNVPFRTSAHYLAATSHAPLKQAQPLETAADKYSGQDPAAAAPTAAAVACLKDVAKGLQGLVHGVPFLRNIPFSPSAARQADAASVGHQLVCDELPTPDLLPSVERGGCTAILNPRALLLKQDAFPARRSDMLWCLTAQRQGFRVMKCQQLAVWHHRGIPAPDYTTKTQHPIASSFFSSVLVDIKGHSLYRAVQQGLHGMQPPASSPSASALLVRNALKHGGTANTTSVQLSTTGTARKASKQLPDSELQQQGCVQPFGSAQVELSPKQLLPLMYSLRFNRVTAFSAAFRRIQCLLKILQDLLQEEKQRWWHKVPEVAPLLANMQQLLQLLQSIYTTEALNEVWSALVPSAAADSNSDQSAMQREDLDNLSKVLAQIDSSCNLPEAAVTAVNDRLMQSRREYAEHLLQLSFLHKHPAIADKSEQHSTQHSPAVSSDPQHAMDRNPDSSVRAAAGGCVVRMCPRNLLEHFKRPADNLKWLGSGTEGMVFRDNMNIYKVCPWGTALQRCPGQLQLLEKLGKHKRTAACTADSGDSQGCRKLRSQDDGITPAAGGPTAIAAPRAAEDTAGEDKPAGPSYTVYEVEQVGPQWLLCYGPYQPGVVLADLMHDDTYLALRKGYMCSGAQLLSLARKCIAADLICCNAHPKNLLLVQPERQTDDKVTTSDWAADGHLLLLDLGCDWLPASPSNILSLLARLYLCWRWWRRQDLPQLLTKATRLLNHQLQLLESHSAVHNAAGGGVLGTREHNTSGSAAAADPVMAGLHVWLKHHCSASDDSTVASDSTVSSSSSSSSKKVNADLLPVPEVDILWLTEQLPELAGFSRFAAAALGCYDAAKERLDQIMLEETVKLLKRSSDACTGAVLDYGCGAKAKLLHQLEQKLTPTSTQGIIKPVHLVGADPAICTDTPSALSTPPSYQEASLTAASKQSDRLDNKSSSSSAATASGAGTASAAPVADQQTSNHGRSLSSTFTLDGLLLTKDCSWAAAKAGGLVPRQGHDIVVCSLVLCTIPDRQQYLKVLDDIATAVKPGSGRVLLSICNPFFTMHGSTPFQQRVATSDERYDDVVCWNKKLQQQGGRKALVREDVHRPLDALLHDLARRGLASDWIHQTPSVSVDRPDEFNSDFLIMSLIQVSSSSRLRTLQPQQQQQLPELQQQTSAGQVEGQTSRSSAGIQDHSETRHVSCLIKVCAQDYQHVSWQIPHLVSRLDLPQHPLAEIVVVVDQHRGPFTRQLSTLKGPSNDGIPRLLNKLDRVQALGWVDRIVLADTAGSQAVKDINSRWFGLDDCSQTHTADGSSTTPTLQGIEACSCDTILQLDVDLLLVGKPFQQLSTAKRFISYSVGYCSAASEGSEHSQHALSEKGLQQMLSILQSDASAVSISLPSLPVSAAAVGTGGRCASMQQQQSHQHGAVSSLCGFTASYINPQTGRPWRTEVRGCLIDRNRMKMALQSYLTGTVQSASSSYPPRWYRALDAATAASQGELRCYRAHYISPQPITSMHQHCSQTSCAQVSEPTASTSTSDALSSAIIISSSTDRTNQSRLQKIPEGSQHALSLEGQSCMFLHPPNQPLKESCWGYSVVKSAVASGCWPSQQVGQVDIGTASDASGSTAASGPSHHHTTPASTTSPASRSPTAAASPTAAMLADPSSNLEFMKGMADLWALPRRTEPLVVVVCGRNVSPGRLQRCFESLEAQDWQEWGLTLIDDCSTDSSCVAYQGALLEFGCSNSLQKRVTHLCWRGDRRGMLFNDVIAIRHVCSNPNSVIVTLDADDMLLRHDALRLIMQKHQQGFDFVTAGHLRTDKLSFIAPSQSVTHAGPSRQRLLRGGGNVWEHLRSFKKALFDAIPDGELRMQLNPGETSTVPAAATATAAAYAGDLQGSQVMQTTETNQQGPREAAQQHRQAVSGPGDVGYYYELANDWAFTVPMAELAVKPGVLDEFCYLYEPSWPRQDRAAREAVIGLIMKQPPLHTTGSAQLAPQRRKIVAVVGDSNLDVEKLPPHRVQGDEDKKLLVAEQVGRLLIDHGYKVLTGGLDGVMSAAMKGAQASASYQPGNTIAILPGDDPSAANVYADTVICTGLGHYRNGIVGRADAVVAIGGGAGTLQEIGVAWGAKRPVIVIVGLSGVGGLLAGQRIDGRGGVDRGPVLTAGDAEDAVQQLSRCLGSQG